MATTDTSWHNAGSMIPHPAAALRPRPGRHVRSRRLEYRIGEDQHHVPGRHRLPAGRVSIFNGLIDGLRSHTKYPRQAWELENWLGSAPSEQIMGSGGYVWPAIESLDPLRAVLGEAGINMAAFLTEAHGKVENCPVSAGVGDALNEIFVDLGRPGSAPSR